MKFHTPTEVFFGENCLTKHADMLICGKKALIVTGKTSARACGALDEVTGILTAAGVAYDVFDGMRQNPLVSDCMRAAHTDADFVIGIGGGSPMDASKAVAILAASSGMTEEELFSGGWKNVLPVVCVGTTAGTGSEVTPISVVTTSEGRKKSIRSEQIYPVVSYMDPRYTYALSDRFTRSTAIDALCHAAESYFSLAATDLSRGYAAHAIKMLLPAFARYDGAPTEKDRAALMEGALYGGLAISVTGTALCHALSYFLSEDHDVPHGCACGVYLPAFMKINALAAPELYAAFFKEIGASEEDFFRAFSRMMPPLSLRLSAAEISSLAPRWNANANLQKTRGDTSPARITALLTDLFGA